MLIFSYNADFFWMKDCENRIVAHCLEGCIADVLYTMLEVLTSRSCMKYSIWSFWSKFELSPNSPTPVCHHRRCWHDRYVMISELNGFLLCMFIHVIISSMKFDVMIQWTWLDEFQNQMDIRQEDTVYIEAFFFVAFVYFWELSWYYIDSSKYYNLLLFGTFNCVDAIVI